MAPMPSYAVGSRGSSVVTRKSWERGRSLRGCSQDIVGGFGPEGEMLNPAEPPPRPPARPQS